MVSQRPHCDPNRLKQLLDDRLPERGQAEVEEHLQSCKGCRQRLQSLAAEASWWGEVPELLRPDPAWDEAAAEATEPIEAGQGSSAAPGSEQRPHGQPSLEFLAPAHHPENLGRLGSYEITELIGHGGMGVVLKGFDETLHRYVAIKVLAPQLACSAAARRRFHREGRAAAAVVHEHVVAIHAVDEAEGLPYLVMPLIPGESLQARLDRHGPLDLREILRIAAQAAAGLAAAHRQGLVHRDVKPANILLENGVERVMITDFGLARAIDDASFTQSGMVAGTPQYMAPEQADGKPVDHRADLFSLGSVMYSMCTGHSPFRAGTTMAVLRRICEGTPRPIREMNPDIPVWMTDIISRLHEKDPADRFESARDVARLLGRHLAHLQQPLAVPMPGRLKGRSLWKRMGRHRRTAILAAVVLGLLLGGFALTELTGVTRLVGSLAGRPVPARVTPPTSLAARTKTPRESLGSVLSPTSEPMGPMAFQEAIAAVRLGVSGLEGESYWEEDTAELPDPLVLARAHAETLGQELDGEAERLSPDSLPAVAVRVGELEQEAYRNNVADAPSIDALLSAVRARVDELEFELNVGWP